MASHFCGLPFIGKFYDQTPLNCSIFEDRPFMNQEIRQLEPSADRILCRGSIAKFAAIRAIWYFAATAICFAVYYCASLGAIDGANGSTIFGLPLMLFYFYFSNDDSETALKIRYYIPAIGAILFVSFLSIPLIASYPGITGGAFVGPLSVLMGVSLLLAFAILRDTARLVLRRLSNDTT